MASSAFSFHCMICFEEFDPATNYPVVLPCGHTYVCIECANRLDKCMECRVPLVTKIEVPSTITASPSTDENMGNATTPSRYGAYRRQTQQINYSRGKYGQQQPPPQKQYVTQRLPLPKNAVLLSLIQASEPARRRQAEEPQPDSPPVLPQSASEEEGETSSKTTRRVTYEKENIKYSKPSPLFVDSLASSTNLYADANPNSSVTGIMIDDHDDEEQKIRVGTYLEGGPCGTYAVAVKSGLLVYPTLFEHTLAAKDEDGMTRNVEELVKNSYRDKYCKKVSEKKRGCGLPRSASCATSNAVREEKTAEITLGRNDGEGHDEENLAVEVSPLDGLDYVCNDEEIRNCKSDDNRTSLERNSAMSDPGGGSTPIFPASLLPYNPNALSKSEHHKPQTPTRSTIDASALTPDASTNNNVDPALSATLKLRRQFSLGQNPPQSNCDPDFDRPLIRLKYGDRVQVVSMDSRGWVKLARGYGYIRLENDKQLVKVGGTSDKACQIEAVLHELSIERNRLKHEQKKLEHLSAGLMIDLQSSLMTSEDMVIVQAPEGMPRSDSELALFVPKRMDHQSSRSSNVSNQSQDDLDISTRTRTKLTNATSTNVNNETQPHEIRTVKSHSPGRNYSTPPSPPYNQTTPGGTAVSSYAMTPTRVNFRTGLSGHRALSSSHSHPHDFISTAGPIKSMSNHAGASGLGSKSTKPNAVRSRSIY